MNSIIECPRKLVYVSDNEPGYLRKKRGRGFFYEDASGKPVRDPEVIDRIEKLVIPPMWTKVWICAFEDGHLQVTGFDAKGRKQYMYHPEWVKYRQDYKYTKLYEFGRKLPLIRKKVNEHLKLRGWPRQKLLAIVVSILDQYHIRIGNRYYEQTNQTYGLTTLRRKHLVRRNKKLYLSYKAKSGKYREIEIHSRQLVKLIEKMSELPGYELFKYPNGEKGSHRLDSQDVNQYLEELSGDYFTAKDFRTWGGTVAALDYYQEALEEIKQNPKLNLETNIVKKVAQKLGNTVATCREYYIHPEVLRVLMSDEIDRYKRSPLPPVKHSRQLTYNEKLVLKIIYGSGGRLIG